MKKTVFIAVILGFLASCAGDGSGIPAPMDPGCNGLEPRLECIQQMVFTPSCARSGCHDAATASFGLVLEEGLSHGSLVGVASTNDPNLQRVVPDVPDDSFLVIKLEGSDPRIKGSPMPLGEPSLSNAEILAIREWIANGAQDD